MEDASVGVMEVMEVVSMSTTRLVGRRILDAEGTKEKEGLGGKQDAGGEHGFCRLFCLEQTIVHGRVRDNNLRRRPSVTRLFSHVAHNSHRQAPISPIVLPRHAASIRAPVLTLGPTPLLTAALSLSRSLKLPPSPNPSPRRSIDDSGST